MVALHQWHESRIIFLLLLSTRLEQANQHHQRSQILSKYLIILCSLESLTNRCISYGKASCYEDHSKRHLCHCMNSQNPNLLFCFVCSCRTYVAEAVYFIPLCKRPWEQRDAEQRDATLSQLFPQRKFPAPQRISHHRFKRFGRQLKIITTSQREPWVCYNVKDIQRSQVQRSLHDQRGLRT